MQILQLRKVEIFSIDIDVSIRIVILIRVCGVRNADALVATARCYRSI